MEAAISGRTQSMLKAAETEKKSKSKREPSLYNVLKKQALINSDNYLLSIDEAKTLLRVDRKKFMNMYIKKNKIPVTILEDGKTMIRTLDLKIYLENQQRIYNGG